MRFQHKVVLVTGAASGFGAAIARRFAAEGAAVVVADIDEVGGKEVVAAIESDGGRALFTRTDVSRSEDVAAMVDAGVRRFDGLDVLVNNAGFSHLGMPLEELPRAGVRPGVRGQREGRLPGGEVRDSGDEGSRERA